MSSLSLVSLTVNTGATVSLTGLGADDWAAWLQGDTAGTPSQRKSGGGSTLGAMASAASGGYNNDPNTYTWSDGTPTGSSSETEGVYCTIPTTGTGNSSTWPASTTTRRAWFYGSYWSGSGSVGPKILAHLSDSSASDVSDTTTLPASGGNVITFVAIFDYAAGSAGQTLQISQLAQDSNSINIDWNAAAVKVTASGVTGTIASTQAPNAGTRTGSVAVSGTEASTQAKNTDALTGAVGVSGTEAATQAPNAGTRTGSVAVSGTLSTTQALNTAALTGTVATGVTGTIASTQAPNTDALAGTVGIAGSVSVAQSANVMGASGTVATSGTLGATQAPNTAALVGAVGNVATGTIASTQAPNTDALTGNVVVSGTEAATQAPNAGTRTGSVGVSGTEAATQAPNTDALAGAVAISGSMAATQLKNTFAGTGTVLSGATGTIAATQAKNTTSITAVTSSGLVSNPLYLVAAAARNYSSVAGARNYIAYK